jgi:hypothetical protein
MSQKTIRDYKLPCDCVVGHITFKQGVSLDLLVNRSAAWLKEAQDAAMRDIAQRKKTSHVHHYEFGKGEAPAVNKIYLVYSYNHGLEGYEGQAMLRGVAQLGRPKGRYKLYFFARDEVTSEWWENGAILVDLGIRNILEDYPVANQDEGGLEA